MQNSQLHSEVPCMLLTLSLCFCYLLHDGARCLPAAVPTAVYLNRGALWSARPAASSSRQQLSQMQAPHSLIQASESECKPYQGGVQLYS